MQVSSVATSGGRITHQARRLHEAVTELLRRYQFRDRNEICCFGVSVSQCHALEMLDQAGELTMGALASRMHLSVSTMTRVVDQLFERGLVLRTRERDDRRVCCVGPTAKGRELLARISTTVLRGEEAILDKVPVDHRESVIRALEELSRAVDEWRGIKPRTGGSCCARTTER